MADLKALTPCDGLLPVTCGGVSLSEIDPGRITALMPWPGQERPMSAALKAAHGVALPGPGRVSEAEGVRCLWSGRVQALLLGPRPGPDLSSHGAVIDQSDGWATVGLEGEAAVEVLARLVPVDLRERTFPEGAVARTLCGHVPILVTRRGARFEIMAFRSMAATLVHEIADAAEMVDVRPGRD